jgi:ABC-type cobalt transport system, permease component CbiQ and related transporters
MGFSSDFYINKDSWLHNLDPRVKLLLSAALMVIILSVTDLLTVLIILAGIHLILISAKIPKNRFLWVWKMMLPVTIMIIFLWPLFYQQGKELFSIGFLSVTLGGILQGLAMALRICALGFACFILLFTTDQAKIVRGMVRLGVPYKIGLMLAITLRYLPTFFGIINMVSDAQKARGLDLEKGSLIKRLKAYMPILVAVLITGLKTSDNLSNALETRAFGAAVKRRTYINDIRMRGSDVLVSIFIIAATCATFLFQA